MGKKMLDECAVFEEDIKSIADWDWESHLAEIAQESPDEFEDLVKMYYKAEPGLYKSRLADTLLILNYRDIIPDLIRWLNFGDIDFEFSIATILVAYNEEIGAQHLINIHNRDPEEFNYKYLSEVMTEYKTEIAIKYHTIFSKLDMAEKQSSETISS